MTTPQDMLCNVYYKVNELNKKFDSSDDEEDFFEQVKRLDRSYEELSNKVDMIHNQLSLIVKLLSKNEEL